MSYLRSSLYDSGLGFDPDRFQFVFACQIGFEDWRHAGNCENLNSKGGENKRKQACVVHGLLLRGVRAYMILDRHFIPDQDFSPEWNTVQPIPRIHVNKYNWILYSFNRIGMSSFRIET